MRIYVNPLRQLRSDMDRLLSGFLPSALDGLWSGPVRDQPAANVCDQGEQLLVEMELPGVKNDQIDISVLGEELSIKVERPDLLQEGVTYHRRERPMGSFSRVLQLPCPVDSSKVEAELHDGVLTLRLPKAEAAKARKITVAST